MRRHPSSRSGSSTKMMVAADGLIHGYTIRSESDGSMTAGPAPGQGRGQSAFGNDPSGVKRSQKHAPGAFAG